MSTEVLLILPGVLLVLLMGVSVWAIRLLTQRAQLIADRDNLEADRQRIGQELATCEQQVESYRSEISELKDQIAQSNKKLAVAEETQRNVQQQFAQAQQQLREAFKSLAGDTLKESIDQFLQLAKKTFQGEQKDAAAQLELRKQAIEGLVKPIHESLNRFQTSVQDIEKSRTQAYGSLTQQLQQMMQDQKLLRTETKNLVTALRRPEVRGRWGEMQLRRVAELAGMIENCDFFEQQHLPTEDGRLKPDMVIRLPSGRTIVVDAKTPLDAFLNAVESTQDDQRETYLEQHTRQIETQLNNLSGKKYEAYVQGSPDFVVLFIPGESFLYPAMQRRPLLLETAMEKGVVIATPSTLISLLKAVAMGWREQRLAENAQRISEAGRELHARLCTAFDHLGKLRKAVESTVKEFNNLVGSLESTVLPQAKRLKEYGADSQKKQLPDQLDQVEISPRELRNRSTSEDPTL